MTIIPFLWHMTQMNWPQKLESITIQVRYLCAFDESFAFIINQSALISFIVRISKFRMFLTAS